MAAPLMGACDESVRGDIIRRSLAAVLTRSSAKPAGVVDTSTLQLPSYALPSDNCSISAALELNLSQAHVSQNTFKEIPPLKQEDTKCCCYPQASALHRMMLQ